MNDQTDQATEETVEESSDLMSQEGTDAIAEEQANSADEDVPEGADLEVDSIEDKKSGDEDANINLIMDLPLQVVVELGRTKMLINDLLQIGQGSVIELNKQVGEALDILVNGKLVARGEVVVVKDKFGVRITEVLSTIERIKQLG